MNYLGFEEKKVKAVAKSLNDLLANYHIYYQNLRNFHWNIQGQNFFELHNQFELLYNDARIKIDEIAERVLTLRYRPMSTLSEYLDNSEVKEAKKVTDDVKMVQHILNDHKILIDRMRKVLDAAGEVSDEGTVDMVGSFLENLEKKSWMLDAWLGRKNLPTANGIKS